MHSLSSGFDDLQGTVFSNGQEILVVMQQSAAVFQCGSRNDAVIRLSDGSTRLTQFSIDVSCPDEYRLWHGQHDQRAEIASDTPVGFVIGNALQDFGQYDAAKGQVFVLKDKLLQRNDMRKVTTCEEIDPDTGIDQNH